MHSDVPKRLREGMRLWLLTEGSGRRELEIEELWPHKGHLVVKFVGVNSISDGQALVGCELQVPHYQRASLGPGWNYVGDLIGCVVLDHERQIGKIEDVRFGAGEAPLLVVRAGANEYEVPYAEAYLGSVDTEHKQVHMLLPEGMLEVNAPMTAEEKREQGSRRGEKRRK